MNTLLPNKFVHNYHKCSGCSGCVSICPTKAVSLKVNSEGFLRPIINEKCTACGLCTKACPVMNERTIRTGLERYYYAWHSNTTTREESSSGGLFSAIAEYWINKGGVVYGAVGKQNRVLHCRADNLDDLVPMRGSKYLPSFLENTFEQIDTDLKNSTPALFSGTPCQVEGLYRYLTLKNADLKNLLTIDLLCHGIPSLLAFDKFMAETFPEAKSLKKINWRLKETIWEDFQIRFEFEDESFQKPHRDWSFFEGYLANFFLNDLCYECPFLLKNRLGDFTLGDFWAIKRFLKITPEMQKDKGISILGINSQKAAALLEKIDTIEKKAVEPSMIYDSPSRRYLENKLKRPYHSLFFTKKLQKQTFKETLLQAKEKLL